MSRRMRFLLAAGIAAAVLLFIGIVGASGQKDDAAKAAMIERGHYLVSVAGCHDCHSPKIMTEMGPVPDSTRIFMGHPADEVLPAPPADLSENGWVLAGNGHFTCWCGPWGISFAANLTSAEEVGLGNWTEESFIKAMRTGKHRGFGRMILPPMPWPNLAMATDDDLKAILAYFNSTKPINNKVPEPVPPGE